MANMYIQAMLAVKDSVTYMMCVRQEVLHVTLAWVKPESCMGLPVSDNYEPKEG